MNFLIDVVAWLIAPEHWVGSNGIPTRIAEHLLLSGLTAVVAVLIALPIGVWCGHTGRGGFLAQRTKHAADHFCLPVKIDQALFGQTG